MASVENCPIEPQGAVPRWMRSIGLDISFLAYMLTIAWGVPNFAGTIAARYYGASSQQIERRGQDLRTSMDHVPVPTAEEDFVHHYILAAGKQIYSITDRTIGSGSRRIANTTYDLFDRNIQR